ncbi:hypothetical protein B005_2825 [Nocardiopsis alba ATCC BAA-2165]|uniref:Uncharacterized protein n=1 Tax=Nocardiopsis alba (strain ATCC BAA-2165 / BE74) TaxID=1205910 RepID=J7LBR2_NOCAA|nr:hypothetical protein B005_2825 [Nocardiopsis alba ATCC BAA-2165]
MPTKGVIVYTIAYGKRQVHGHDPASLTSRIGYGPVVKSEAERPR